jgi:hypothetical protein
LLPLSSPWNYLGVGRYWTVANYLSIPCLVLGIALSGCDRSEQTLRLQSDQEAAENGQLINSTASPRTILNRCISRYQELQSYEDRGFVRLKYLVEGVAAEDRAPLSVAWNKSGRMGLKVYSVTAGPHGNSRWHLHLGNSHPALKDQTLSRSLPERLDFAWLLSEPLVNESLSAGLAGFPPQLDMLLSPQPLSRLVDETAELSLLNSQLIDHNRCWIISIVRGALQYRFWIDQQSLLVRRIELPPQLIPEAILSDTSTSQLQLSIELQQTSYDHEIDWDYFKCASAQDSHYVTHFVAPPLAINTSLLGKQIPAFQLRGIDGQVAYDSSFKKGRRASVLIWLADHPACLAAAEQLALTQSQLQLNFKDQSQIDYIPIWAETAPPVGLSFEQLQQQWKLPGRLAIDRDAAGRDLFGVQEAPTVVILDAQGKIQFWDVRLNPMLDRALAPLVARVAEGANLAAELINAQQTAAARHRVELFMATANDPSGEQRINTEPYPPESVQLTQIAQQNFTTRLSSLNQDSRQMIWALQNDGTLHELNWELATQATYQTGWANLGASSPVISHDSRYFAVQFDKRGVEIWDTKAEQSIRFPLPEATAVIDMKWLTLSSSKAARLAVITSANQVLLLDPANRQQLSGSCPGEPIAIVTQSIDSDVQGAVVLASGALEPLVINGESEKPSAELTAFKRPSRHRKLTFQPRTGSWCTCRTASTELTLGEGWLAKDEPALFFLDDELRPVGQYRLPAMPAGLSRFQQVTAATSPSNGAVVWAALDATGSIHLLRGDVSWFDHFRFEQRPVGIALIPSGDRLQLVVASQNSLVAYRID